VNLTETLEGREICVVGGSGGVGKTTTAATIAMGMAARGLKVAVVTIDPARRLANSLGLEELDNEPRLVDPGLFADEGLEMEGELWAMMLDPKRTFDDIVEKLAPTPEARDEVLSNRIYKELSNAVAGSQEYTAMAKLWDLHEGGDWDLLVLDTPPSRNALDFLDAPDRLTHFLEGRALQVFLRPTGIAGRIVGRGTGMVFSVLRRVTGVDLLEDLSVFFRSLSGMIDGFRSRAKQVNALLADERTMFLLVTSPEREPIDEAIFFWRKLKAARMPFGGAIVNRVHHDHTGGAEPDDVAEELPAELSESVAAAVLESFRDYHVLARRDAANVEHLAKQLAGGRGRPADGRMMLVPHLDEDVHDIGGLLRIHRYLFATEAEREMV